MMYGVQYPFENYNISMLKLLKHLLFHQIRLKQCLGVLLRYHFHGHIFLAVVVHYIKNDAESSHAQYSLDLPYGRKLLLLTAYFNLKVLDVMDVELFSQLILYYF